PEGDKQALNQNGIPAELALAIAKEKSRTSYTTVSNPPLNTSYQKPVIQTTGTNKFSHAKNPWSKEFNGTVPKAEKKEAVYSGIATAKDQTNSPRNPFSGSRKDSSLNTSVSGAYSSPIKNVTSVSAGAVSNKPIEVAKTNSNVADKKVIKQVVSMKPIALEVANSKTWVANTGSTLNKTLNKWVLDEKCSITQKWNIVWPENIDYPIDVQLSFNGTFYDAITKLFALYA
ncbi:TcpQ domain-containing protein, partial [Enterobacter hormaechei]|uniref:TcpQ domain-containing protein n=2 Tax=Enterobacter TaxID=547 RepID=UPI000ACC1C2D